MDVLLSAHSYYRNGASTLSVHLTRVRYEAVLSIVDKAELLL